MPDLLLELRSEEIPARMQRKAAGDLRKLVTDGLVEAGLTYEGCREYWTPRRLALDIRGLTARSKDVREEKKGPSTKAPEQAIQGFLRSAGLADLSEAHVHSDPKKGDFYVAHIVKPGRSAEEIVAALVPGIIRDFPWPKSMRWGAASGPKGRRYGGVEGQGGSALRWVRPLQSILCTFGPEGGDTEVIDFEIDGIRSGNVTYGHRFHAPGAITVKRFDDYLSKLEAAKVVLDADRRKEIIRQDAANLAFASGLELVEDEALLEEVSGLVEWPVVLMGAFEEDYLAIPPEVIRLTIRANQKCFVVRPSTLAPLAPQDEDRGDQVPPHEGVRTSGSQSQDATTSASHRGDGGSSLLHPVEVGATLQDPRDGRASLPHPEVRAERASKDALANRFLLTANIEAKDGGAEIVHGNGKVVRARLSDALYFWKTDQADLPDLAALDASAEKLGLKRDASGKLLPLDQRMARLDHLNVTFHAKLGTQGERVQRIARLAEELARVVARPSTSPSSGPLGHLLPSGEKRERDSAAGSLSPRGEDARQSRAGEGDFTALARRAALLAKADLTTEIVGEFPELQGAMGRKYALLQGEHASVAAAIEEHYKPQGPSDRVPTDPVSIAVALADKLDTLVGFWAIDEKPTGSKDPFALRRAALGVIRIVVENGISLAIELKNGRPALLYWIASSVAEHLTALQFRSLDEYFAAAGRLEAAGLVSSGFAKNLHSKWTDKAAVIEFAENSQEMAWAIGSNLLAFFYERLKVYLRDQGARHDLIDAVLGSRPISPSRGEIGQSAASLPSAEGRKPERASAGQAAPAEAGERSERAAVSENDDLLAIVRRVEALGKLLDTEDGRNLLAGAKRAANILAAEEKKGTAIAAAVDPALFAQPAETALFDAVNRAESKASEAILAEDFSAAMLALATLRRPIDAFFEQVLVNDDDPAIRANRLALLARIRAATGQVADFSKIAG